MELNLLTIRPCENNENSILRQLDLVQNPRGLMHLERRIHHFYGVSFDDSCFLTTALSLWLFDLTILLPVKQNGGAITLSLRHLLNLSKNDLFIDGVCSPHSDGIWVTLVRVINAKKGNLLFYSKVNLFLCEMV